MSRPGILLRSAARAMLRWRLVPPNWRNTMVIVIARVQARPDQADALADLLSSLPAASRQDPGCTSYAVSRDLEDGTRFSTLETWDSRADLDAHLAAPHTTALLSRLPGLVAAPPTIHAHEVSTTDQVA